MKKINLIIISLIILIIGAIVVFFILKKKNKLPAFLSGESESLTIDDVFEENISTDERSERIKTLQKQINSLLPESYTKLTVDGQWGDLTQTAYDLVKTKIESSTIKKGKETKDITGGR